MEGKHALLLSCLVGLGVYFGLKRSLWEAGLASFIGFLGLGGLKPTLLTLKTLPRDMRFILKLLSLLSTCKSHHAKGLTVPDLFSQCVSRHPKKAAIIFEDQTWTFEDIDRYSNRIANMFRSMGFVRGDKVAINMMNRPEYTCILLGLSKIGVAVPLINYNLTQQSLLHCVEVADVKGLIYEESLESSISWLYEKLSENLKTMTFCIGEKGGNVGRNLESEMKDFPDTAPPPPPTGAQPDDWFCYIYTSGTTGLPKAVPIRHTKYFGSSILTDVMSDFRVDDIIYINLPLYHTAGGTLGMGQMIVNGKTVVLARKFSARQFWKDCIKNKCTAVLYIGESCRYVLAVPPDPSTDTAHCVRVAIGNGLRRDVWAQFQERFKIPKIVEFYGSTEGNSAFFNIAGKTGAVGFKPKLLGFLFPVYLVKSDPTTGEAIRNSEGYCTCVPTGEPGLLINLIKSSDLFRRFDGYTNSESTNKKIMRNVFKKGDCYFNTGDILSMDDEGYLYFNDRAGDTFRWKGENVSTTEVENVIGSILKLADIIVFGVEIPNAEGRAGMVVILSSDKEVDVSKLATELSPLLPSYAMPLFLRFVDSVDLTGTFKFQKMRYRKEGFNPAATGSDAVYVLNKGNMSYVPFDEEQHQKIMSGMVKF